MTQKSSGQVLITGVYRSGTEFFSHLIDGHPRLRSTMYHVNAARFLWGRFEPLEQGESLARALAEVSHRLSRRYAISLDSEAVLRALGPRPVTCWTLYDAIMSTLWLEGLRTVWAEKCQLVWRAIPAFLDGMPNGRAIMIVRDPRNVLASFKRFTRAPAPAYLGACFNCLDMMRHALSYRDRWPDRIHVVRYEDAARSPADHRAAAWRFVQLDPAEGITEPPDIRTRNSVFDQDASRPFDVDAANRRWKHELDEEEVALAEAVAGPMMTAFGYEPSGVPLNLISLRRRVAGDDQVRAFLDRFLLTGVGVEAFPADPLDPRTWSESAWRSVHTA